MDGMVGGPSEGKREQKHRMNICNGPMRKSQYLRDSLITVALSGAALKKN